MVPVKGEEISDSGVSGSIRPWIIWAMSFGVWTFVALAYGLTVFELYRSTRQSMPFLTVLGMQSSQVLTYIPLTPFVFALANRYQDAIAARQSGLDWSPNEASNAFSKRFCRGKCGDFGVGRPRRRGRDASQSFLAVGGFQTEAEKGFVG